VGGKGCEGASLTLFFEQNSGGRDGHLARQRERGKKREEHGLADLFSLGGRGERKELDGAADEREKRKESPRKALSPALLTTFREEEV